MKRRKLLQRLTLLILVTMILALGAQPAPAAHADGETNARINGSGCNLVDAIVAANTDTATGMCAAGNPGADTIELLSDVVLSSAYMPGVVGLPLIESAITIEGGGHTIARDVATEELFRILMVYSGELTLNDTTITGGHATSEDVMYGYGAGIFNVYGMLTLNSSTISGNTTSDNGAGSGIFNYGGVLTLNTSTVSDNTFTTITVGSEEVPGHGIGIANYGGTATLNNSTVSGNRAFDGQSTQPEPGGIVIFDGEVVLNNSTVSGNSGTVGGIGLYGGTLTIERSLISGNMSTAMFDGVNEIYAAASINSSFSLFGHSGESAAAALYGFAPGSSDIIATSDGTAPTALFAILEPLADNGGPTLTHALPAGSPAIDAAPAGPAADQRGVSRPQGAAYDIGAFEVESGAANTAPVIAADSASVTVDEGQTAGMNGTFSDPDGDVVTLSASAGTVNNNGSGTWSWSAPTSDNNPGRSTVTITASDGKGGVGQASFILYIFNADPVVEAGTDQTVYRNDPVTVSGTWSDPAGALDNPYTWVWDLNGNGEYDESDATGEAGYGETIARTTSFADAGVYTLAFWVGDASDSENPTNGGYDTVQITVVNRPVENTAPVIAANSASVVVDEGQTAANSGTFSDPDGDTVALSASAGTVNNNCDGTWSWSAPAADGPASATVTITADDGEGGVSQASFGVTVNNVAPVAEAGPDQTVYRNDVVTLSGTWTDPAGALDSLYTLGWDLNGDGKPDTKDFVKYGDTLARTTSFAKLGVFKLTFFVNDADNQSGIDALLITVANRAPVANDQAVSTDEDTPLPITLTASDADNDFLVYSVVDDPAHGTFSGTVPNLIYTPDPGYFGPDSFTFRANDGVAESNLATVSITVKAVNIAPAITVQPADQMMNVGDSVSFSADASGQPAPTVQWQVSSDDGASFGDIPGATETTLSFTAQADDIGKQYRAVFTNVAGSATTVTAKLIYTWSSFSQPVDNLPTLNTVKAGQGIGVKFSLGADYGLGILAAGSPSSLRITCPGGVPVDAIEETTTSSAGLHYDAATNQYIYVWKTDKAWAGTCRQFNLALADGTTKSAGFSFTR